MKKIFRYKWQILAVFVVLFALWYFWPARYKRTISYETTRLTTPVDELGYLDYETFVNEMLKGDIKPEENAMVLLVQAIGPKPEGSTVPPDYYQWLEIAEPEENDTTLTHFTIPDPVNPNKTLNKLPEECGQPWAAEDYPEVAEYLKASQPALQMIADAIRRPKFFNPLVNHKVPGKHVSLMNALLAFSQRTRGAGLVLQARAMNAIAELRFEDAWRDIYAIQRLGRLLQTNPSCLVEQLVGIAIENTALESYQILLTHTDWNAEQIHAKTEMFQRLPAPASTATIMNRSERCVMLDIVQEFYVEGFLAGTDQFDLKLFPRMLSRSIDFDVILRKINTTYDKLEQITDLQDYEEKHKWCDSFIVLLRQAHQDRMSSFFLGIESRSEAVADMLLKLFLPAFSKVDDAAHRCKMQARNIEIAFALAECNARTGNYPDTLAELKLPPEKLLDAYNGKQLRYQLWFEGYILYSPGVNDALIQMLQVELEEPNQNIINPEMKIFRSTFVRIPWVPKPFQK
ncbi:MAG: hypothetical protein R3B84_16345 [Zavarzinella sp.]